MVGSSVTFTATVKTNGVTADDAGGTVLFLDGLSPLSTVGVTNGVASFSTSALLPGARTIWAQYSGDGGYAASTNSVAQQVNAPPFLLLSVSGNQLHLSWSGYLGWILQQQTNALDVGLGTNWTDMAGTALVTTTNVPLNAAPTAFYRLRHP
jgi:hypothetical protein